MRSSKKSKLYLISLSLSGKLSVSVRGAIYHNEAKLLNISDNQLSYITNVESGRGLIKCGSTIVPFMDRFPSGTKLYQMMTTRTSDKERAA